MLLFLLFITAAPLFGAILGSSSDGLWTQLDAADVPVSPAAQGALPVTHELYSIDANVLSTSLSANAVGQQTLTIPLPYGTFTSFVVTTNGVLSPAQQALHPEIQTYSGHAVADPTIQVAVTITPSGFQALVLGPSISWSLLPHPDGVANHVIADNSRLHRGDWQCLCATLDPTIETSAANIVTENCVGNTMRKFNLAIAVSENATADMGGQAAALAYVTALVNNFNLIFEKDLAVRFVLVSGNSTIYDAGNPEPNPYPHEANANAGPGGQDLGNSHDNIVASIGQGAFDVGFSLTQINTGGGGFSGSGLASTPSICRNTFKGEQVSAFNTYSTNPGLTSFYVDLIAHEIGHQFGAGHTFSGFAGNCNAPNYDGAAAVEVGSGTTLMSYAGICGADNVTLNNDAYFHGISLEQMNNTIASQGCEDECPNNNNDIPQLTASDIVVPLMTPFTLAPTTATDNQALTYTWEQVDPSPRVPLTTLDNGVIALYRSYPPIASSSRTYPTLSGVLSGTLPTGERWHTVARTLNFRLTARDCVGGVCSHDVQVRVADAGPIIFTGAAGGGGTINCSGDITWDPNETDTQAGLNGATVNILITTDDGATYTTLASNVPNDGSHPITIPPGLNSSNARIRIEPTSGAWFAISDTFTVSECVGCEISIAGTRSPTGTLTCSPDISYTITVNNGPAAQADNVQFTLAYPDCLTFQVLNGITATPINTAGQTAINLGNIPANGSTVFTIVLRAPACCNAANFNATATITAVCDTTTGNNSTVIAVPYTRDTTLPVLTCPAGGNLGVNPTLPAPNAALATASDNCSAGPITVMRSSSQNGCVFTVVDTYMSSDPCGNMGMCQTTYTFILDTEAPVLNCTDAINNLGCNPPVPVPTPTATDNCGTPTITTSVNNTSNGCQRTTIYTIVARDAANNQDTCTLTYNYTVDTTGPTFTGCTDMDLGCNPTAASFPAAPTVFDACDSTPTVTTTISQSTNNCVVTRTETYMAIDDCNNPSQCSRTLTWREDTTPPTVNCPPSPQDLGCNPTATLPTGPSLLALASDDCGIATSIFSTNETVNACVVTRTVNATFRDACNNQVDCSVTVTFTRDTAAPTFIGCADIDLGCNPAPSDFPAAPNATDGCGTPTITMSSTTVTNGCGVTITESFTATDACNNTGTCTRVITFSQDANPTFTCTPGPTDLGCNPATIPTADALLASVSQDCSLSSISATTNSVTTSCVVTLTHTATAVSSCGATGTCSQAYTYILDTSPPVFVGCADMDLGCNPAPGDFPAAPTVTDNCSTPTVTMNTSTVTNGCGVTITETFTATDACNNTGLCTRVITFSQDTSAPTFNCNPGPTDLGCNPAVLPTAAPLLASVMQECSLMSISAATNSVTNGCLVTLTLTATAVGSCGATGTCSQAYTYIVDTAPPVFSGCADMDLGCNPAPNDFPAPPTVTDNCGTPTVTMNSTTVTNGCGVTVTETFTATDACNNTGLCTRVITFSQDTSAPTFTCNPGPTDLGCNPAVLPTADPLLASVMQGCSLMSISATTNSVTNGCLVTLTHTATAVGSCGATGTCSQAYTYTIDTELPAFTVCGPALTTLGCNPTPAEFPDPTPVLNSASDNCGIAMTGITTATNITDCLVTLTETLFAIDNCGNTATCERVITYIQDTTPPDVGCPSGVAVDCSGDITIPPLYDFAAATDNCGIATTAVQVTSNTTPCELTVTRTYTVIDNCGNPNTCTETLIFGNDVDAPVFNDCGPTFTNLGCNPGPADFPSTETVLASATDACTITDTNLLVDLTTNGVTVTRTETFTATDRCGNTGTCSRVIEYIVLTDAPVITCAPVDLGCNPSTTDFPDALDTLATATSAGGIATSSFTEVRETNGCQQVVTRTFSAIDICGQEGTCTQTITWVFDFSAPTLPAPSTVDIGCNPDPADFPDPMAIANTATDNCPGTPIIQIETTALTNDCAATRIHTITATDACGNAATTTLTVAYIIDDEAPVFTCPAAVVLACGEAPPPVVTDINTIATDNCGITASSVVATTGTVANCRETITRVYTATDACGNTASCTQTITQITGDLAPTVTSVPTTPDCNPSSLPTLTDLFTATETCGESIVTQLVSQTTITNGCFREVAIIAAFENFCGKTTLATNQFSFTVDVTPPVITVDPLLDLGCNPADIPTVDLSRIATDNCTPASASLIATTNTIDCLTTITRVFTATDDCGISASATQLVQFTTDTEPPTFTACDGDADLGCNPTLDFSDTAAILASATDNCGLASTNLAVDTTTAGCIVTRVETYTAVDTCGLTGTCQRVLTWTLDTTPPTFDDCMDDTLTLEAGTPLPTAPTLTATDDCGLISLTTVTNILMVTPFGTNLEYVTTAEDCSGNQSDCTLTIAYLPPQTGTVSFVCDEALALGCNPASLPNPADTLATAASTCGDIVATDYSAVTNRTGCDVAAMRLFIAVDSCGVTGACMQTINWTEDTTPPTLTCPSNLELGCNPDAADLPDPAETLSTATDDCGIVTLDATDTAVTNGCNVTLSRVFSVTDACANTTTCTQEIQYVQDSEAPVIGNCPTAAVTLPSGTPLMAGVPAFTLSDNCGLTSTNVTFTPLETKPNGDVNTRVELILTDCSGNATTCRFDIVYDDPLGSTIITCPTDVDFGCLASPPDLSGNQATASSPCGDITTVELTETASTNGCTITLLRAFTATDTCDTSATCTQIVTYTLDDAPPQLTCPDDIDLGCNPATFPPIDDLLAAASDTCATPVATVSIATNRFSCRVTLTRVLTATDDCGNTASCTQRVTYTEDTQAPIVVCPENLDLGCNPDSIPTADDLRAEITERCGIANASVSETTETNGCLVTITRTLNVTDECGNPSSCSQILTYTRDTTPPEITCPADIDLGCNPADIPPPADMLASATDNCATEDMTLQVNESTARNGCEVIITRVYTVSDACGNPASCSQTVTYTRDTSAPFLSCTASIDLGCNPANIPTLAEFATDATAIDSCANLTLDATETTNTTGCLITLTRTLVATDACGNRDTCSQTLTYATDDTAPTFETFPEDVESCNMQRAPETTGRPTASDNCADASISFADDTVIDGCMIVITRTWRIEDVCGRPATREQTIVLISDEDAPLLSGIPDMLIFDESANGTFLIPDVITGATILDTCTGATEIFQTPAAGSTFAARGQANGSVTVTARDKCGNEANKTVTLRSATLLGGSIWEDTNLNGRRDPAEPGISDVSVSLLLASGTLLDQTTTDADGNYLFSIDPFGPESASYIIAVTPPDGVQSAVSSADSLLRPNLQTFPIPLVSGFSETDIDLGLARPASIDGLVYNDVNNNGRPDENLATLGFNDARIELFEINDPANPVKIGEVTTQTRDGEQGRYRFDNLMPGAYELVLDKSSLPSGMFISPESGRLSVNLAAGQSITTADILSNFTFTPEPTAVALASISATQGQLTWSAASEAGVLGYEVIDSATGTAIHPQLILAGDASYTLPVSPGTYILRELTSNFAVHDVATVTHFVERDASPTGGSLTTLELDDLPADAPGSDSLLLLGADASTVLLDTTVPEAPVRLLGAEITTDNGDSALYLSVPEGTPLQVP